MSEPTAAKTYRDVATATREDGISNERIWYSTKLLTGMSRFDYKLPITMLLKPRLFTSYIRDMYREAHRMRISPLCVAITEDQINGNLEDLKTLHNDHWVIGLYFINVDLEWEDVIHWSGVFSDVGKLYRAIKFYPAGIYRLNELASWCALE